MRLVLVRHAESVFNAQGRFTGLVDVALSARGMAEAERVAAVLSASGRRFGACHTSTLRRATVTARTIIAATGCDRPCIEARELDERDYGELSGMTEQEAEARWDVERVRAWRRGYADVPPGGESLEATRHRVLAYYEAEILPAVLRGQETLVVSHGNTLRALVMALTRMAPSEVASLVIGTCEPIEFDVRPDGATVSVPQGRTRAGDDGAGDVQPTRRG